jgi:hypothetical protein
LGLGQPGRNHGKGHGNEHAAREPLQAAHRDHGGKIARKSAGHREQREKERASDDVIPEGEHAAQIGCERDHHDFADQIGGRNPGSIIDAGANASLDVKQRGIGDLDVQNRHEGADHPGDNRDPCRQARLIGSLSGDP